MNKLSIAALIAGTAAVTGFVVSKVLKNKKRSTDEELFGEEYDDCCCDSCACGEDLDVVIPAEETEDCAETVGEADEKAEDAVKEAAEDVEETAEDLKD